MATDDDRSGIAAELLATQGDQQALQAKGLNAGDRVVTDGADRLRAGSKVEVVKAAKP